MLIALRELFITNKWEIVLGVIKCSFTKHGSGVSNGIRDEWDVQGNLSKTESGFNVYLSLREGSYSP